MLRDALAQLIAAAIDRLVASGDLPEAAKGPVEISDTKQPEHGDYACNFALAASKKAGMNPRELAEKLCTAILKEDEKGDGPRRPAAQDMISEGGPAPTACPLPLIHEIEVAGPGFLNFRLRPESVAWYVEQLLELGENLPNSKLQTPKSKINVEFVSVNPNGPITVGSARGAAFGDTLCRILEAAGHPVVREYYINDGVNSEQMRLFAESVRFYYRGEEGEFPENGYKGEYVQAVAQRIHELFGASHKEEPIAWFQARSQDLMIERQRTDLGSFEVNHTLWFSEQSLHNSGSVASNVEELERKGVADEDPYRTVLKLGRGGVIEEIKKEPQTNEMEAEDGPTEVQTPNSNVQNTLWLRSTKFGDDMDRVLRRRDGRLTYIASDVAYHSDKLTDASGSRGGPADKLITILGPDHHGYIGRLHAVLAATLMPALGNSGPSEPTLYRSPTEEQACKAALVEARTKLDVIIYQIVRFMKDGKPAPMRKRDGNIYELRDLIRELGETVAASATNEEKQRVGADVARFFFLMRSHDTALDFDIDLATKQSDDNPVFYVQYAHARICSVIRKAEEIGLNTPAPQYLNTSLLTHPKEQALIKKLLDLPMEVRRAAVDYGVHRIATYAIELARTYHNFYDACRVIQPEEPELSQARLALCEASRAGLKSALNLLGISAPERMEREPA